MLTGLTWSLYLDGVHDDSEAGNSKLIGVPQVVVVQVTENRRRNRSLMFSPAVWNRNCVVDVGKSSILMDRKVPKAEGYFVQVSSCLRNSSSETDICTTNGRAPLFVEASSFCMEHYCQKGATQVLHCRFKCKTFIMEVRKQSNILFWVAKTSNLVYHFL